MRLFTAAGSGADRITFNADRTVNSNALWHGLAFTDACGTSGEEDRHTFDMVDIAILTKLLSLQEVGQRPNGPSEQHSKTVMLESL